MTRRVESGRGADLLADARAVREAVFVEEQGVDPGLEYDDHDGRARHFAGYEDGRPVAAARLRELDADTGKVERVAVREPLRGAGWGTATMDAVHDAAREAGYERLRLHAQTRVRGFYESLDYEAVSDPFEEAGMEHVAMVRRL